MSGNALKWTALVLMLVDHIGEFFPQVIPVWFRWLGRLSAPLFIFCLAKGLEKTRSRKNYIKRLWLGSIVMGTGNILLMISFPGAPVAVNNNIFSTMTVTAFAVWIIESLSKEYSREDRLKHPLATMWIFIAVQIAAGYAGDMVNLVAGKPWAKLIAAYLPNVSYCEGGIGVVILGLILYFAGKSRRSLVIGYCIYCALELYSSVTRAAGYGNMGYVLRYFYQWMMIGSLPLMLCYNGERGKGGRWTGRFFYLFYPLHIWALFVLSNLSRDLL